jgi:hypothetical protein
MTKTLVTPCDWPGPVVSSLTALWDAMDDADTEVCKAVRDNGPAGQDLKRLQEEFNTARYQLYGFLLDTLAPELDEPDCGTPAEEAITASAGQLAAQPHKIPGPRPLPAKSKRGGGRHEPAPKESQHLGKEAP